MNLVKKYSFTSATDFCRQQSACEDGQQLDIEHEIQIESTQEQSTATETLVLKNQHYTIVDEVVVTSKDSINEVDCLMNDQTDQISDTIMSTLEVSDELLQVQVSTECRTDQQPNDYYATLIVELYEYTKGALLLFFPMAMVLLIVSMLLDSEDQEDQEDPENIRQQHMKKPFKASAVTWNKLDNDDRYSYV